MALEDAGEALAFVGRRRSEMDGTRNVRRAVLKLSARVEEKDFLGGDGSIGGLRAVVVDDGTVGAAARDRRKAWSNVVVLLSESGAGKRSHISDQC